MNINLIRLRGVVKELQRIAAATERLAACWESQLAEQGINMRPPKADLSGPEPELTYVDEEADALAEIEERLGLKRKDIEAEED